MSSRASFLGVLWTGIGRPPGALNKPDSPVQKASKRLSALNRPVPLLISRTPTGQIDTSPEYFLEFLLKFEKPTDAPFGFSSRTAHQLLSPKHNAE